MIAALLPINEKIQIALINIAPSTRNDHRRHYIRRWKLGTRLPAHFIRHATPRCVTLAIVNLEIIIVKKGKKNDNSSSQSGTGKINIDFVYAHFNFHVLALCSDGLMGSLHDLFLLWLATFGLKLVKQYSL